MYFDELSIGQTASSENTVTQAVIDAFAAVSTDQNPVHVDPAFAAGTPFGGTIAHGMLSVSYISALLGNSLPGPGTIYLGQTVRFLAPVRPGDTVRTVVTIRDIHPEKRKVICETACYVGDKKVIDGEATLLAAARPA